LWRVWALLLLGFCFIAAGDILFAYLTTLGLDALDPLLHLVFVCAYVLIAWGVFEQRRIVAVLRGDKAQPALTLVPGGGASSAVVQVAPA
jgi:hypothetical protein